MHCRRPVDPPPEDLLPEYITIEELGKILEGGPQIRPEAKSSTDQEESGQQNYVNCLESIVGPVDSQPHISSIQSKIPVVEIDLTEDDCDEVEKSEEEFTSVCENVQSPRSSCSESELQIDISEHDVHMSLKEKDYNQLTSQSCAEVENSEEEFTSVCEKVQSPRSSCSESELQIDISEHDVHMSLKEQDCNQLTSQSSAEVENSEEGFTSVCEKAQSPRSSCSESELQIDISEHDVYMSLNEQDCNQLTSQSYKAKFQCETCPYETDIKGHFEVHLKVHRTVFACDWCYYITKSKFKLKNHQIKKHKPLVSHLMINCSYCDISTTSQQGMKRHLLNVHQKYFNSSRKKSETETLPEVDKPMIDEVSRPDSPYSEPRLEIDLENSVEYPPSPQSNCIDSEVQMDITEQQTTNLTEPKLLSGEPSTNKLLLEQADIKVEYLEELVETTVPTQLSSQSRKAQFQCDICPYETDFQDQFEVHQKVHRTVYACPLCKYRTSNALKLSIHQSLRCRKSPPNPDFDCPMSPSCTFSTSTIANLKGHLQSTHHYVEKRQKQNKAKRAIKTSTRFRCKICGKRLNSQTTVKEHMWTHTFIRIVTNRYKQKCPKCDFIGRSPHVMRNHYIAIHPGCPHYDPNNVEEFQLNARPKSGKKVVK